MKLEWLEIRAFRHSKPTRLVFGDGVHVLLGKNGTGKTNLLELISMVVRGDLSALSGEDYDLSWRLSFAGGSIDAEASGRSITREGEPSGRVMVHRESRSRLTTVFGASTSEIVGGTESFVRQGDVRSRLNWQGMERESIGQLIWLVDDDWQGALVPWLAAHASVRFDEQLGAYRSIVEGPRNGHPGTELQRHSSAHHTSSYWPMELLTTAVAARDDAGAPRLESSTLFQKLCTTLGFASIDASPVEQSRKEGSDGDIIEWRGIEFRFHLPGGSSFRHNSLSFGQKRALAFFWHNAVNRDVPVIADELVNGLHHSLIKDCLAELEGKQAFLATQNPLLVDYLEFSTADDARHRLVQCHTDPEDSGWVWGHLEPEDAAAFFAAYEVGFEHVNDILRSRGMW